MVDGRLPLFQVSFDIYFVTNKRRELNESFSIAGIGCGVTMVSLGLYLQYKFNLDNAVPPIEAKFTWFPVACLFGFTICCTLGYLVVPWVMIGELYPQKVRGLVGGMTTFAAHSFVFIVVKTYPMLAKHLEQHGTFILYGAVSLTGAYKEFFLWAIIKESFLK